ncbi:GNAT family N-acetyltransferase [Sphingomonas astaxanthinifaciens]|uniref:N-acetyltransferase n=1 Tax=Sphingomonas astaxanthinifaciens DSM 22298 TaxID=1123267 RepID=A0ABQ5Z3E8_9SPHN|nr:GNAT family N-acetyltransferase [Sphingomonas astaxanthinifaciens]GLR46551.1 N-acetyltransferase [Sphingomonas astaxanthinifaciens DSM 22298]
MKVVNNEAAHRFEIALDDGQVAFAEYRLLPGLVAFPHTVVPPAHEGQGLASAIARASLDWAREQGLKVAPRCSFYAKYMARHPETHDLLDADSARALGI